MIDRRQVLAGLSASLFPFQANGSAADVAYIACCKKPDGEFGAALISDDLNVLHVEPLAARGHDAAISPDRAKAVIFARRPGRFAIVIDLLRKERVSAFSPPPDRHFYGHGFFSNDGHLLFATENAFEDERGELGIYDATNGYKWIGAFDSGGIGPHEALLLSDGRTIAVANGGIVTHPDYPRQKLNLATMAPSITLIDIQSGTLLETATLSPEFHQLSVRHMAKAGDGSIWFGGQYEGSGSDLVPLIGTYEPGSGIRLVDAPDALYRSMNHYIGSVAASRDGAQIAVTAPRGNIATVLDVATGSIVSTITQTDVCGISPSQGDFLMTDGAGGMSRSDTRKASRLSFDNHLASALRPQRPLTARYHCRVSGLL